MYRFGEFTSKATMAINLAIRIAGELGHTYVGSEHLLWGLCGEGSGVAACVLLSRKVTPGRLGELLVETIGSWRRAAGVASGGPGGRQPRAAALWPVPSISWCPC